MKQILLLSFLALVFSSFTTRKQIALENKFTQFIVEEADTKAEAQQIDRYMRAQSGVVVSRMDHVSKKYFVVYSGDQGYDKAYFAETFQKLGFSIKCFREGVHGVDKVIDQNLDCE
jgi:hypothetical protein